MTGSTRCRRGKAEQRPASSAEWITGGVIAAWFGLSYALPDTGTWAGELSIDWGLRIAVIAVLVACPETKSWIRQAFSRGLYRYEPIALFLLRVMAWVVLLFAASWILSASYHQWGGPDLGSPPFLDVPPDDIGLWRATDRWLGVPLIALSEELVFRVALVTAIERRLGSRWLAVLVSAILFGAFHFGFSPAFMVVTGVIGALWAYAFVRTRSIWPSLLSHWLNNTVAFL